MAVNIQRTNSLARGPACNAAGPDKIQAEQQRRFRIIEPAMQAPPKAKSMERLVLDMTAREPTARDKILEAAGGKRKDAGLVINLLKVRGDIEQEGDVLKITEEGRGRLFLMWRE